MNVATREGLLALARLALGLAVYFATLSLGLLIASALRPEWYEKDPSLESLVLVFPGAIFHFILLLLLHRVANNSRLWWHSWLFAALCGAIFMGVWVSFFS